MRRPLFLPILFAAAAGASACEGQLSPTAPAKLPDAAQNGPRDGGASPGVPDARLPGADAGGGTGGDGMAPWHNVQIVAGSFIPGIVFNAKQKDLVYARTDIGGAYRLNPVKGSSTPLLDWVGFFNVRVGSVKSGTDNKAIGLSYDGGENWYQPGSVPNSTGGGTMAEAATPDRIVWSPTGGQVSHSNGGNGWTQSQGLPAEARVDSDLGEHRRPAHSRACLRRDQWTRDRIHRDLN